MENQIEAFDAYREEMNKRLLSEANLPLKRFFSLDSAVYEDGALNKKTKELLGLMGSMVLRCDDCIKYHLKTCFEQKVTKDEILEVFSVALIVGGSIVIPHTRRAFEFWESLEKQ